MITALSLALSLSLSPAPPQDRDEPVATASPREAPERLSIATLQKLLELLAGLRAEKNPLEKAREEQGKLEKAIAEAEQADRADADRIEELRERIERRAAERARNRARLRNLRILEGLLKKDTPSQELLAALERSRRKAAGAGRRFSPEDLEKSRELFAKVVGPALEATRHRCHNPDKLKGDLDLTTRAKLLAGGTLGPAVLPGSPDESPLFILSSHREEPFMPPSEKKRLPPETIQAIHAWIETGAAWDGTRAAGPSEKPALEAPKAPSSKRLRWF